MIVYDTTDNRMEAYINGTWVHLEESGMIDISSDTNLIAGLHLTLTGDTLDVLDDFVLNTGRNPFFVRGDAGLIQIILRNSLSNALDATSQNPEKHRPEIIVTWGARGAENWIRILDNGPGLKIPVSRVFLPGTSAKPGHFGLGLTIVDLASRSLDGTIELTSRKDRGVRFEFQWPRTE